LLENYPLAGHLPFAFTTLFYPLALAIAIHTYHWVNLAKRGRTVDPYTEGYMLAFILLAALSLWFSLFFYKAAFDSTYLRAYEAPMGTVLGTWKTVVDQSDLARISRIIDALRPYYFVAGLAAGLSILPALMRSVHTRWFVETPLLAAGPLIFIALESKPLNNMRFSLVISRKLGADGASVYEFLARPRLMPLFYAGLVIGVMASLALYSVYKRGARGA